MKNVDAHAHFEEQITNHSACAGAKESVKADTWLCEAALWIVWSHVGTAVCSGPAGCTSYTDHHKTQENL
eukprot:5201720-Amphidinium_carterae.2